MMTATKPLRIALVGPCASGKSTLSPLLSAAGYDVRQPTQEHSFVPDMWRRLTQPDVLIFLDVSHEAARRRRPLTAGGPDAWARQQERLRHARANCDFYLDTSELTPWQVSQAILAYLKDSGY